MDTKLILVDLECLLIAKLRPTFLYIDYSDEDDDINIIISTRAFKRLSLQDRISSIFSLLKLHLPYILNEKLIIIQAYDSEEIEQVIENRLDIELQ